MKQSIINAAANVIASTPRIVFLIAPVFAVAAYGFCRALALLEAVQNG